MADEVDDVDWERTIEALRELEGATVFVARGPRQSEPDNTPHAHGRLDGVEAEGQMLRLAIGGDTAALEIERSKFAYGEIIPAGVVIALEEPLERYRIARSAE